jgi:uncharacterized phage protein gp47/JayE
MPIKFPTLTDETNKIRADIIRFLPSLDPTIFGSRTRALADSLAGRSFDLIVLQKQLLKQMFPAVDGATGDFLLKWAAYETLVKNEATEATGNVTFTGTITKVIPDSTSIQTSDSKLYTTQAELTLVNISINTTLARSGSTVTATTASDHQLASGQDATIDGAVETDYNGTFEITVIAADQFTYTIPETPSTPATGIITTAFNGGTVEVESVETGQDQNQESGAQLDLVSPIAGVNTTARVQFSQLDGGTDDETDPSLLGRTLQSRANPVANFNPGAIEKIALSISGVTRVKVKRITPEVGAVTILFVRDDDTNIIPSAGEVQTVKDAIVAVLPATSDEADVVVTAPTPVPTDYTFSSITPDTPTMRTAVDNNLDAFYRDEVDFETNITEDKYRSAIINTIDPDTGDTLTAFALSTPASDITVSTNEIGVKGVVIF